MNFTAIGIIAIICWTIVKLTDKGKKPNKPAPDSGNQTSEMQQHIAVLQERIAVLEAIVTDEKYALKREFEDLNRNRAA